MSFSQPENQHVKFNVDVKVQNDPDRLFHLMHQIISKQPQWETALAPRILLGLWHPKFLAFAKDRLPYCRRSYIGSSTYIARKYFWADCDAFSMSFGALTTMDGQRSALSIFCFFVTFSGTQTVSEYADLERSAKPQARS